MILNSRKMTVVAAVLVALLLDGCAAGNSKIASRKGYVRFPGKHYASGEKAEIGTKIEGWLVIMVPAFMES